MLFGGARIVLPGKMDRVRRLAEELQEHRSEYDALNARFRIRTHAIWASHLEDGTDIVVNMYDMDPEDLRIMSAREWDPENSAYDRWWLAWLKDVAGVDLLVGSGFKARPEPIFDSTTDTS